MIKLIDSNVAKQLVHASPTPRAAPLIRPWRDAYCFLFLPVSVL